MTTGLSALILWRHLKRFYHQGAGYANMVNEMGEVVLATLTKKNIGEVKIYGTIMRAKLDPSSPREQIEVGEQVTIIAIEGTTLIVK